MLEDAQQRVVVARDVAADESRGVSERHVELGRHGALLLGVLDEGVQVITNHLSHASRRHGDHVGLVEVVGVGQAVNHVVQATEHGCVFGHRGRHARGRLLEVTREVRAVVGDAALRTVHEGHGLGEAVGHEDGTQRLAGLGGVDHQRITLEVLLFVVFGLGPLDDLLDLVVGVVVFELFLAGKEVLILGLTEQQFVVDDLVGVLRHGALQKNGICSERPRRKTPGPDSLGQAAFFQGALVRPQIGLLMAMSMSRAKMAKPS